MNHASAKLECVAPADLKLWFQCFIPTVPEEATVTGTIRAFCSDCTPEYKQKMIKENHCLWERNT